jgi:hypothetical protein
MNYLILDFLSQPLVLFLPYLNVMVPVPGHVYVLYKVLRRPSPRTALLPFDTRLSIFLLPNGKSSLLLLSMLGLAVQP